MKTLAAVQKENDKNFWLAKLFSPSSTFARFSSRALAAQHLLGWQILVGTERSLPVISPPPFGSWPYSPPFAFPVSRALSS